MEGIVRDSITGVPIEDADVRLTPGTQPALATKTNAQGRYKFADVTPGPISIRVLAPNSPPGAVPQTASANLRERQELTGLDVRIAWPAEVSGTLTDEQDQPVEGATVWLVAREYALGELRYIQTARGRTDKTGHYSIRVANPGRTYLLMAAPSAQIQDPISTAPTQVDQRPQALVPTFYPGTELPQGGLPVLIRPGEQLDRMNFRIRKSPGFCASGKLESEYPGDPLEFEWTRTGVTSGIVRTITFTANWTLVPDAVKVGLDGSFRVCDLAPGTYRVLAHSQLPKEEGALKAVPRSFGSLDLTIVDRDLADLRVPSKPRLNLPTTIEWSATPGDAAPVKLQLTPMGRVVRADEKLAAEVAAGANYTFEGLLLGDYEVFVTSTPPGTYVQEVLYGGASIRTAPLRLGTALSNATLRVILARDGGRVTVHVEDRDGNPARTQSVILIPQGPSTELAIAGAIKGGATNQDGNWASPVLPPGKYTILTSSARIDFSPESIARLWNARQKGREVEITMGSTAQITLSPDTL